MYIERLASNQIRKLIEFFPVVALTGPRQSGKTTLLKHMFPEYQYISFDTPDFRNRFNHDPKGFLGSLKKKVLFDEIQKLPDAFEWIKASVDTDRTPGRFILTGSTQFNLIRGIGETLAGRCGFQILLPFERAELPQIPSEDLELKGWYPELVSRNWALHREWYEGYTATYLERDIRSLLDIGNLADFYKVLTLCAVRTAQELNVTSIAREVGVTEKTVTAWISVLEASYIVFKLKPWHKNLGKRIVKRPKLYFWDTGLACHLSGIRHPDALRDGPLAGALFENLVIADMAKHNAHCGLDRNLWYFRANGGIELDFIQEDLSSRTLLLGEIKRRETVKPEDSRHIKTVMSLPLTSPGKDWTVRGMVLRPGHGTEPAGENIESRGIEEWSNG